jgi:hypothetical protein
MNSSNLVSDNSRKILKLRNMSKSPEQKENKSVFDRLALVKEQSRSCLNLHGRDNTPNKVEGESSKSSIIRGRRLENHQQQLTNASPDIGDLKGSRYSSTSGNACVAKKYKSAERL